MPTDHGTMRMSMFLLLQFLAASMKTDCFKLQGNRSTGRLFKCKTCTHRFVHTDWFAD